MSKNKIKKSEVFRFDKVIDYQTGSIVSHQIIKNENGNVTLFAFDKNQGLSTHTAPFDAIVYIIDGKASITISAKEYILNKGETIIMPKNKPHSVKAIKKFKMLLIMIK